MVEKQAVTPAGKVDRAGAWQRSIAICGCGDPVEFRILGSVEVTVGPEISISALRRLFTSKGHAATISKREQGYVLEIGAGQLDSQRFDALVAAARAARDAGQADLAVANYRDALRLWRGPALEGIDSQSLQATVSRLDEQRIAANEERIELELDLGRHHELVGELSELVGWFLLRERLRGHLMLALYRCGRQADALAVYRQTRHTLIDELGIEPGERLRRLEQAILTL